MKASPAYEKGLLTPPAVALGDSKLSVSGAAVQFENGFRV